ncbi:hypothetical protein LINPERHAP1_LOCUS37655, partial [Linum perenne]
RQLSILLVYLGFRKCLLLLLGRNQQSQECGNQRSQEFLIVGYKWCWKEVLLRDKSN